jgi:hypothetical protein
MREASLRPQSLGVVASGHQQRSRNLGSDTDEGTEIWGHLLGEAIELGVDRVSSRDVCDATPGAESVVVSLSQRDLQRGAQALLATAPTTPDWTGPSSDWTPALATTIPSSNGVPSEGDGASAPERVLVGADLCGFERVTKQLALNAAAWRQRLRVPRPRRTCCKQPW